MAFANTRCAAGMAGAVLALAGIPSAMAQGPWPESVSSEYRIEVPVMGKIGTLRFQSKISGTSYTAEGDGEYRGTLGVFSGNGKLRNSGIIAADDPRPADYGFEYSYYVTGAGSRTGSVAMGFTGTRVAKTEVNPPVPAHPETVPLTPQHLENVFDPLAAVLALSRSRTNDPCGRSISIFTGEHRFELRLWLRRVVSVREVHFSGQPRVALVCGVRYRPIAGHRMDQETNSLMSKTSIEAAIRPVPGAGVMVPYHVVIPGLLGTLAVKLQRADIVTAGRKQIKLLH